MRLDKFLKVSRLIKRRTVAKEVAEHDRILVNGQVKKPAYGVKVGDIIEIAYYNHSYKARVLVVPEGNVRKDDAETLYEIIEGN